MQMVNCAPDQRRAVSPVGWTEEERRELIEWCQEQVENEEQVFADPRSAALATDQRAMLREAALAIGSLAAGSNGLKVKNALRSMLAWFWTIGKQAVIIAPKADLREASLEGADLDEADLREADLTGAHLSGAQLEHANLERAILKDAIAHRASLGAANLHRADLSRIYALEALFTGAVLTGAVFDDAKLQRAELVDADLAQASLESANLDGANLLAATYDAATRWPDGFDPARRGAFRVGNKPDS